MKDDDGLFLKRSNYLEETYFSWSIVSASVSPPTHNSSECPLTRGLDSYGGW